MVRTVDGCEIMPFLTPLRRHSRRLTAVATLLTIAFVLLAAAPLVAQQSPRDDAVAAAKSFSIELELQEIITTDLKRLVLRDCGKVTFEVRDPGLFVSLGAALVAQASRQAVISARRAILADKSAIEVRDRADAIRDEIRRAVDENMKDRGVAIADMAGDLRACAVPVRPPE